jgi:competence protein ComEA
MYLCRAMWKQFLREYFTFNKKERNGIVVLLLILGGVLVYNAYVRSQAYTGNGDTDSGDIIFSKPDMDSAPPAVSQTKEVPASRIRAAMPPPVLTPFNPNTLSREGWEKMGLSEKQSRIILNYVEKGGRFRRKEDLRKIYGLRPEQEQELEPFVRIPSDSARPKTSFPKNDLLPPLPPHSTKLKEGENLEINGADSVALLTLPCIGPAFAHRILAYRKKIGGFFRTDQLMEIFGMDEERFACFVSRVRTDTLLITKIHINQATTEELRANPYIRWNLANLMVSYRKKHGNFRSPQELSRLELIDERLLGKLRPYLSFE